MRSTLKYDIIVQNYGGLFFMKTKIIYISGSEVFEMADVRAAFEEVRSALGLGRDTVLFGVPVDNDDALAPSAHESTPVQEIVQPTIITTEEPTDIIEEIPATPITQDIIEPEIDEEPVAEIEEHVVIEAEPEIEIAAEVVAEPIVEEMPTPVKKSRGRPRKTAIAEPVADITPVESDETPAQSDKVIPILSVLAANNVAVADTEPVAIAEEEIDETPADEIEETIVAETAEDDFDAENAAEFEDIDDMIADQAPDVPVEKTLEQLLESMTPLREDHGENIIVDADEQDTEIIDIVSDDISPIGDADATLEQLAAEFANTEDKIAAPAPTQSQGKIGKLKNILPFKKARRDDTGLMGDLFGWAGVAANDEDFAIPGFFTTAASKK